MFARSSRSGIRCCAKRAREVTVEELASAETQQFIDDLIDTMRHANGAGIAANQVGVPIRIATIEVGDNPRYPYKPRIPLTVVVNPIIEPIDDELVEINEGCLSVPNLRGSVHASRQRAHPVSGSRRRRPRRDPSRTDRRNVPARVRSPRRQAVPGSRRRPDERFTTWEQFERFHRAAFVERITEFVARVGS